jgi:hypothetical protein
MMRFLSERESQHAPSDREPELPMSTLPSSATLIDGLRALPPRALRFLGHRHLGRHSLAESAAHFGISEEALRIHLLRSARELLWTLESAQASSPLTPAAGDEVLAASALEANLTSATALSASAPSSVAPPAVPELQDVERLTGLCQLLRDRGPELLQGIEEAERAEFDSPRGRLRERLRLAAIATLVLLTLWMSLR